MSTQSKVQGRKMNLHGTTGDVLPKDALERMASRERRLSQLDGWSEEPAKRVAESLAENNAEAASEAFGAKEAREGAKAPENASTAVSEASMPTVEVVVVAAPAPAPVAVAEPVAAPAPAPVAVAEPVAVATPAEAEVSEAQGAPKMGRPRLAPLPTEIQSLLTADGETSRTAQTFQIPTNTLKKLKWHAKTTFSVSSMAGLVAEILEEGINARLKERGYKVPDFQKDK